VAFSERFGGAQDGAGVARILNASKHGARASAAENLIELQTVCPTRVMTPCLRFGGRERAKVSVRS